MNNSDLIQVADILWSAESSKKTCDPIRTIIGEQNIKDAYAIQKIITQRKIDRGDKIVGRKIGLTSQAVQKQLGVSQPDFGSLTDRTQVANGGSIGLSELMQPKIEAEIAFVLKTDLDIQNPSQEDIVNAIDYASPAIEIVGSRITDWNIRIADTVADNASASHFVVGDNKVNLSDIDLINCKMRIEGHQGIVSEGVGSACLDNPITAVQWLANTMIEFGTPLRQGEIILSGALGPMHTIESSGSYSSEIEGLGSVSVTFS
jgi:2-keto-4-pentenoate hydratase